MKYKAEDKIVFKKSSWQMEKISSFHVTRKGKIHHYKYTMIWIMGETDKNLEGNASNYSQSQSLSAETWVCLYSSIRFS